MSAGMVISGKGVFAKQMVYAVSHKKQKKYIAGATNSLVQFHLIIQQDGVVAMMGIVLITFATLKIANGFY
jgi:hypothetical protein